MACMRGAEPCKYYDFRRMMWSVLTMQQVSTKSPPTHLLDARDTEQRGEVGRQHALLSSPSQIELSRVLKGRHVVQAGKDILSAGPPPRSNWTST
jgi:hypothetical protein